jgi:uncharacterized protein YutE (UPF0331/DUF86 family)
MREYSMDSTAIVARISEIRDIFHHDENVVFAYLVGRTPPNCAIQTVLPPALAIYLQTAAGADQKLRLFNQVADVLEVPQIQMTVLNSAPVNVAARIVQHKELIVDKQPEKRILYEAAILREFYGFFNRGQGFKKSYTIRERDLMIRRLSELPVYRNRLAEFSGINVEEYLGDRRLQRVVEQTFSLLVETCADIAVQVVEDRTTRTPGSCAEAFRALGEQHVIDFYLAAVMITVAAFRTAMLQSEEGGQESMLHVLKRHLGDFDRFRDAIITHLKRMTRYLELPLMLTLEMQPLSRSHQLEWPGME